MIRKGPIGCTVCDAQYINAVMESFWDQAVQGQDQLRQRTVLALSELFVVSTVNSAVEIQADAHASYLDRLSRNAFGNFRTLIEQVSNRVYGSFPTVALGGPEDSGQGRLIPTTSVDEYGATLARWFGVSDGNMRTVLPNIGRFANRNLGFMS